MGELLAGGRVGALSTLVGLVILGLALLPASATSLAVPAPAPSSAFAGTPADNGSPRASTRIDDRDLEKSKGKKKWTKVSSRKAYEDTLSRTQKAKATAATKAPATNGGSVTFQAGPGRGKFVVTAGTEKKKVKTSNKSVRFKTVEFQGAGPVTLKVKRPGRNGVYLDAVALENPTAPPAATAPPASACASGTSDGGTLTSAPGTPLRVCQLPGRVTQNMVLQRIPNLVYSLSGPVEVGSDLGGDPANPLAGGDAVTLTVESGVVVIADDANDALFVNRGSRLNAIGTASERIIFTSRSNLAGTATENTIGEWGGIVLLGRGPISDCNAAVPGGSANCQQVLDGLTQRYGGNAYNDTSGSMRFVQIRYAGAAPGIGVEGAGLRVAAAGQLTTLDHIQVANSAGDALALVGGRANVSHAALIGAPADLLDTDFGYRGTVQYLAGAQSGAIGGDAMIEADANGNEDAIPRQYTRVSNATLLGQATPVGGNSMLLRGGTDFALLNTVVTGPQACLDIDATGGTTTRAADGALQDIGPPIFRSVRLACTTPFRDDGNVSLATVQAIFGDGTNNNESTQTPSLVGLVNGPNETAVTATDPTPFNADTFAGTGQPNAAAPNRMTATSNIGAIQNASDPRFVGWTCDMSFANFGSGVSCVSSPI